MTLDELTEVAASLSIPKYRADQIYNWLQIRGAMSYDEMTNLPKDLREKLTELYPIKYCEVELKQVSKIDSTVKYLFRLSDGNFIESVLMKYKYGYTLCISSQVGCKMGCVFCASTKSGCVRNLLPSEMIGQIHAAQRDMNVRVSHVVMMGMGEPLDNFDNAMRFLQLVGDDKGLNLSIRNISLSTCGVVPRIYDLLDRHLQLTLSVSLHAPNDEMRSKVMPINRKYPIAELIKACRIYTKETSRRISFEYAMIKDVNDSDACAYELASLLKGMLCHVNLIPANEIVESSHRRSTNERLERFTSILNSRGINTTVRRSLGSDIDASCGQLRSRHNRETSAKEGN
ncbi:MAG: 23S rRNA (adenine(2503)-C(2))-methyltransferase RlmN [Clostridia bacterium]|nr:23S rRNA (adenine(2503)-C(2))-methyltransferase RlmN [Clostridia bacterium]